MKRSRGYAVIAAAVLVAIGIVAAVLLFRDDEASRNANPTTGTTSTPGTVSTASEPAPSTRAPETEASPPPRSKSGATDTSGQASTAPLLPYALAPTRRCLQDAGFMVSKVRSTDPRLRALGDLAQKTSLQARREGETIGLAFGDTRLLVSLLRVPNDPYRLEVRRNALLMYRPAARRQATALRRCLRS